MQAARYGPLQKTGANLARYAKPRKPAVIKLVAVPGLLTRVGIWAAQVWNERAWQMYQVAEGVRHSIRHPLLDARLRRRRHRSRIGGVLRGVGRAFRFFRRREPSRWWLSRNGCC